MPWAAGAVVSDARDLAHFYSALLGGRILVTTSLAQMKQTVVVERAVEDGLGIFPRERRRGSVAVISVRGGGLAGPPPDPGALLCPTE